MYQRVRRSVAQGFVCWLVFVFPVQVNAVAPESVLKSVSQSLVKIETPQAAATGFIWQDSAHVVTSLHVVDNQTQILVHYVNDNGRIDATRVANVERVLSKADLVLLRLDNPLPRKPLTVKARPPGVSEELDALGFPLNISGYSNTSVRVRFGGNQLRSILPPKALARITSYPSKTLKILNLEGNLVPGLSGAPIINKHGHVVGVVDGGLENGAIGISWGIPSAMLNELARSPIKQLPNAAKISELFAADLNADVSKPITVGDIRMTKLRSRTLAQLAETADDQLGLTQLAYLFSVFDPLSFSFDIYQDENSGATIVVPQGATLTYKDGRYQASLYDQRTEMVFQLWPIDSIYDAQVKSVFFEQELTGMSQQVQVIPDPQWSYLEPISHLGVLINRKALFRNTLSAYGWQTEKYFLKPWRAMEKDY